MGCLCAGLSPRLEGCRLRLSRPNHLLSSAHHTVLTQVVHTVCALGRRGFQPDLPLPSPQVPSSPRLVQELTQARGKGGGRIGVSNLRKRVATSYPSWWGDAEGTSQNQASRPQSYKINGGARAPSTKTFLSPPTCIFLTAEEDGGPLLIVPRPAPPGPAGRVLSLRTGPCLRTFLPLQADRSPYVDH